MQGVRKTRVPYTTTAVTPGETLNMIYCLVRKKRVGIILYRLGMRQKRK